jgi:3-methylfumaryl-CoA hydratase
MSITGAAQLRACIGRTQSRRDQATAWPVAGLTATLDRSDPEPQHGDTIPPGWHWLYFLEAARASDLGPEGHPKVGEFLPDTGLPRRMWAGGRIEFHHPLRVGDSLRRDSEIIAVEPKEGRTGRLVFVTVRHSVTAGSRLAVVEEHDIVYREAPRKGEAPPVPRPAPTHAPWRREWTADPVMLFRYSALTFIGHRIHYDIDYCRQEEGYPGLLVHGPLQTILLLDLCRRHATRAVAKIDYRAVHPIFHFERFSVCGIPGPDGASAELWTANAAGNYGMRATVCFI